MVLRDTPIRRPTSRVRVVAVDAQGSRARPDQLVTEEPMEIRVHGPGEEPAPLVVTMRTPGNDFELAAGFCLTEGVITEPDEVASVAYCVGPGGDQQFNVVTLRLRHPVVASLRERRFVATASCGLCGKTALDDVGVRCAAVASGPKVAASTLRALPSRLGEAQAVFDVTGGLHAAATFDVDGARLSVREDVGRHNALDKLVGEALLARQLPLSEQILMVSGRLSFELVQKAAVAGLPIVCAVSAPSSLAVKAADRFGQTLVGFLRDDRFNVYSHPERVAVDL
jgi:formate dehydrogenase family accessory protein FdhD